MDTNSQHKNTVTSFVDALFTKGDLDAVDEYLAEDYVDHNPPLGRPGTRDGMREAGAMIRAAFPDWHSDLGFYVAEGDLVIERFTAGGTQQGAPVGPHRHPARDQHLAGTRRPHHRALGAARRPRPDAPARPGTAVLTLRSWPGAGVSSVYAGRDREAPGNGPHRRCYAGLGVADLRAEVLRRLRRIMPVDAAFFGTVDPETLLFTSALSEEPLASAASLFLDNEYGRGEVNKFAAHVAEGLRRAITIGPCPRPPRNLARPA